MDNLPEIPYYLHDPQRQYKNKYIKKPGRKSKGQNVYDRPRCSKCNKNLVAYARNPHKPGVVYWRNACHTCLDKKYKDPQKVKAAKCESARRRRELKRLNKMKPCVFCGFMPINWCQMDWDHINGDALDNRDENLQLLCANCHRLKTVKNGDNTKAWHYEKFVTCPETEKLRENVLELNRD